MPISQLKNIGHVSFPPWLASAGWHFVPDQDRTTLLAVIIAVIRRGGDRQPVAVELEEPDLVGPCPPLVPGNIDMVDHLVLAERIGAGIGHHRAQELNPLLVGGHQIAWGDTVLTDEYRIHSPVRGVAQIAVRMVAELVMPATGCDLLPLVGAQLPGAENLVGILCQRILPWFVADATMTCWRKGVPGRRPPGATRDRPTAPPRRPPGQDQTQVPGRPRNLAPPVPG